MTYNLNYFQFNEFSILINWPENIDENILQDIINYKNNIENNYFKHKVEAISAYNSLLIVYNNTIDNINDRFNELKALYYSENTVKNTNPLIWKIPVCYDAKFGIDLEQFSKEKKLSKTNVISLHSDPVYTVYFIGFLPGFLYLGGLSDKLFLDRKITPNLNVKKGSVAIGGQQTGIYPQDSPGGWHVIGNSPIQLFNANNTQPCVIKPGDKVKFIPVAKQEYDEILDLVNNSNYQLKPFSTNA